MNSLFKYVLTFLASVGTALLFSFAMTLLNVNAGLILLTAIFVYLITFFNFLDVFERAYDKEMNK